MQNGKNEPESDKEQITQGMSSTQCSESCQERLQNIKEIYNEQLSPTAVYLAYDVVYEKQVIIKKIFKNKLDNYQLEQARLESFISCNLSHFNLCKGYAQYENNEEIGIFMEFVNDADYFVEKIENNHQVIKNELKLKSYIIDILKGLQKIHQEGYAHLDIKLSNLYCVQKQQNDIRRVKVADFGLCHKIDKETGLAFIKYNCGTLGYKSPEVKDNSYVSQNADMWSLGIVLYMMVCAYKPDQIKGYKYGSGPIPFRVFDWKNKSVLLKQFVEKLLRYDWKERITCEEALKDPWFQQE
ncbi:protein kinase domain protein [Ichthyophthirius multifiliis]|uniref:Protein kinase domain protein n=1 Tax=Ichthyophthirius multifiliis TaxID=5932 RepID=G0QXM7_ICHMU|nr:protein kinase domain protein [Ichthyophthirius multifiliis]EGR30027.1 protein kinase domain protein [Ichthyophthirius multifiliis]|eukprot:XP_004031263.1 protein kinase domain protein [Ichthyophthirius multifiliis]